jgi:hypothetical protein
MTNQDATVSTRTVLTNENRGVSPRVYALGRDEPAEQTVFVLRKSSRFFWWAAIGLILLVAPHRQPGQAHALPELRGTYLFVGSPAQVQQVTQNIDRALSQLSPLFRPLARHKLRQVCQVPSRVTFAMRRDQLTVDMPPWPPRTTTLDNRPTRFRNAAGQQTRMQRLVRGQTIREVSRVGGGHRTLTYAFSHSGRDLNLHWQVGHRPMLPAPVTFALSYRRAARPFRQPDSQQSGTDDMPGQS